MASLSQPPSLVNHSWTLPAHYLLCNTCRNFRDQRSREAEDDARRNAHLNSFHVGELQTSRVISISPQLRYSRVRNRTQQQGLLSVAGPSRAPRRVTIQVPYLGSPVRPNQSPALPGRSSRKRPSGFSDNPEPPQYFFPAQLGPSQYLVPAPPRYSSQDLALARPASAQRFIRERPNTLATAEPV